MDFDHYQTHPKSRAYKNFVQLWSRLIEKHGLYPANKVQNRIFNNSRANNSGITRQILLMIKHPRYGAYLYVVQLWSRLIKNVASIVITRLKTAIFNLSGLITSMLLDEFHSLSN